MLLVHSRGRNFCLLKSGKGILSDDWYIIYAGVTERGDYEQEGDVPWQAGWLQWSSISGGSSKSK